MKYINFGKVTLENHLNAKLPLVLKSSLKPSKGVKLKLVRKK